MFDRLFGPAEMTADGPRTPRTNETVAARAFWTSPPRTPPTLRRKLDSSDGRKLDEYLYAVREVERRVQKAEAVGCGAGRRATCRHAQGVRRRVPA